MKKEIKSLPKMAKNLKWGRLAAGKVCGVYMLMRGKKILYIGASVNIASRLMAHRTENRIRFNDVRITKLPPSRLKAVEKSLIQKHQPKYNYVNTERQKLGIPVDDRRVISFNLPRHTISQIAEMAADDHRSMTQWLRLHIDAVHQRWWLADYKKKHHGSLLRPMIPALSPDPMEAQPATPSPEQPKQDAA